MPVVVTAENDGTPQGIPVPSPADRTDPDTAWTLSGSVATGRPRQVGLATMTSTTTTTEYYAYVDTPFDRLLLVGSRRALTGLYVATHEACPTIEDDWAQDEDGEELRGAREQLDEYFVERRTTFDLPLEPRGTDFQMAVWREIATIPYGETVSYGGIAGSSGPAGCGPGGRRRHRTQPDLDRDPLPPGGRLRREPHRLRVGIRPEDLASRARGGARLTGEHEGVLG